MVFHQRRFPWNNTFWGDVVWGRYKLGRFINRNLVGSHFWPTIYLRKSFEHLVGPGMVYKKSIAISTESWKTWKARFSRKALQWSWSKVQVFVDLKVMKLNLSIIHGSRKVGYTLEAKLHWLKATPSELCWSGIQTQLNSFGIQFKMHQQINKFTRLLPHKIFGNP